MEKKCIRCGSPVTSRGLCRKHYVQFNKAKVKAELKGVPVDLFDEQSVKRGLILPSENLLRDDYDLLVDELSQSVIDGSGTVVSHERTSKMTDAEIVESAEREAAEIQKRLTKKASNRKKAE